MTTLPFTKVDSFAFWRVPADADQVQDNQAREALFKDHYLPNDFPTDQLPADLTAYLAQMSYVLVGMNPGNGLADQPDQSFTNFHGARKSQDYKLAAALYGTALWGAFMTDLSETVDSNPQHVAFNQQVVTDLESHLDALGIPANATLIAVGQGAHYKNLVKFAHRPVKTIPHYSPSNNGHWTADNSRQKVLAAINQH